MNNVTARQTILAAFRQKEIMKDVGEEDDFFEFGVSSLSVIELQIAVEDALGCAIPTSQLMSLSTIKEWIEAYTQAIGAKHGAPLSEAAR